MSHRLIEARARLIGAVRHATTRLHDETGDVPGWVLITLMTAGLVTAIWLVAEPQLTSMFQEALNGVTGP